MLKIAPTLACCPPARGVSPPPPPCCPSRRSPRASPSPCGRSTSTAARRSEGTGSSQARAAPFALVLFRSSFSASCAAPALSPLWPSGVSSHTHCLFDRRVAPPAPQCCKGRLRPPRRRSAPPGLWMRCSRTGWPAATCANGHTDTDPCCMENNPASLSQFWAFQQG